MRRILLLIVGLLALAIAVPSAASAHGRHHGHGHHHKHKAKHARVKHFGGKANVDPSGPAAPGDAGTVASCGGHGVQAAARSGTMRSPMAASSR